MTKRAFPHGIRARIRVGIFAAGLLAAGLTVATAAPESEAAVEDSIKAAYIYHFCNYIDWPAQVFENPDSPLVLGVAGSAAMTEALRQVVENRIAHNRPMAVRPIDADDSLEGVHLLFIAEPTRAYHRRLIAAAADRSILVVTEGDDGLDAGGMISFIVQDDRVRFDIAPDAVRQRDLDISAQLLTVARIIREGND